MIEYVKNIPLDLKTLALGVAVGIVVDRVVAYIYKKIDFKSLSKTMESVGIKAGKTVSFFLRTKLGKKAENLIESLLIDVKILIDILATSIIVGLRSDNAEKSEILKNIKNREKEILK